jgi:hypothetical protein
MSVRSSIHKKGFGDMSRKRTPVPCRLFGLLAKDAPRAVILRRGPTQRVQLLLWHTDTDTFEEGQWFYGRIYEWGCDLSPDGTLFLYLARKPKTRQREMSRTTHKWTALSRPPYFTALALWPCGDRWDGGGMFLSQQELWLCYHRQNLKDRAYKHFSIKASYRPERFDERYIRNGWERVQPGQFVFERHVPGHVLGVRAVTHQPLIWRKYHPDRRYCLVEELYREPDFSFESLTYLVDVSTDEQLLIEETTWIDWDQRGRLVFARAGKLFASLDPTAHPLQVREIADFNGNTPTAVIAPYQGKKW